MSKFILIASLLSILGCGNSDLESAIYRQKNGVVRCALCLAARRQADEEQMKKNYETVGQAAKFYQEELSEMRECYDRSSLNLSNVDIVKISSSSTNIKDVWDVKIVGRCQLHGEVVEKAQYSFRDGKARWIKSLEY